MERESFTPTYQYEIEPYQVEEGDLIDVRLPTLIHLLGMPSDKPKVRVIWAGVQAGKSFKEYEVEFFGIKLDSPPDPNVMDFTIHDGNDNYAHIWVCRVRWKDTKAIYEETWIPGDGPGYWASSIRNLHLVGNPEKPRERKKLLKKHCQKLSQGAHLITHAKKALGRGRPSLWTRETLLQAVRNAASTHRPDFVTLPHIAKTITVQKSLAPALTGEALRKLLDRHTIPWKPFKKELRKRT